MSSRETRKDNFKIITTSRPTMNLSALELGDDEKQNIKKEFAHAK